MERNNIVKLLFLSWLAFTHIFSVGGKNNVNYNLEDYFYDSGFQCWASNYKNIARCKVKIPKTSSDLHSFSLLCLTCPMECSFCADILYELDQDISTINRKFNCIYFDVYSFVPRKVNKVSDAVCIKRKHCESSPCKNGGTCFEVYNSYVCQCDAQLYYGQYCEFEIDPDSGLQGELASGIQIWHPTWVGAGHYFPIMVTTLHDGDINSLRIYITSGKYQFVMKNIHQNKECEKNPKLCNCPSGCKSFYFGSSRSDIGIVKEENSNNFYKDKPVLKTLNFIRGWSAAIRVEVYSRNKKVFDQTKSVLTTSNYFNRDTDSNFGIFNPVCFVDADINKEKCSETILGATEVSGLNDLIIDLTEPMKNIQEIYRDISVRECDIDYRPRIMFSWMLFRLDDVPFLHMKNHNDYELMGNKYTSINPNNKQIKIEKKLLQSGVYHLKMALVYNSLEDRQRRMFGKDFLAAVDYCYFKVRSPSFKVEIDGAKSIEKDFNEEVYIKVKEMPNMENVVFMWSCKPESHCPKLPIPTKRFLRIPPLTLSPGEYVITVTATAIDLYQSSEDSVKVVINKPDEATTTDSVSSTTSKPTPEKSDLYLQCRSNCGPKYDPDSTINYSAYKETGDAIDVDIQWFYTKDDGAARPITDIIKPQREGATFDIQIIPNKLSDGERYTIIAKIDGKEKVRETFVFIKSSRGNGTCIIYPTEGIRATTLFRINCTDWAKEGDLLIYQLFDTFDNDLEHYSGRMLGTSWTGKFNQFHITRDTAIVYVINEIGLTSSIKLPLKVTGEKFGWNKLKEFVKLVDDGYYDNQFSRILRLTSIIADIAVEEELTQDLLDKLILQLTQIHIETSAEMLLFISTIKIILQNFVFRGNCKINHINQEYVGEILFTLADKYHKFACDRFHSPKFKKDDVIMVSKLFLDSIEAALAGSDKNVVLSPEEDVDYNIMTQLETASTKLQLALNLAALTVSYFQEPGGVETDITSSENKMYLRTKIDRAIKINKNDEDIIIVQSQLANSFEFKNDVLLEYIVSKDNLYWWASENIRSDLVFVSFATRSLARGKTYYWPILSFKHPLYISIPIRDIPRQIIEGKVEQLDPKLDVVELDLKIRVHRFMPPPLSKVYIKFIFKDDSTKLRVHILDNSRPDWDSMTKNSSEVNKNEPTVLVPYDTVERYNSYYMGILPDKDVPVNTSTAYSFEVYYMNCQVWSTQWINHYCLLSDATTEVSAVCACTHLSVFAIESAIPPNDINPFADSHLFLTIIDNPFVTIFMFLLLLVLLLLFIWAFVKDRKDALSSNVIVLEDNYPGESYGYLIAVHTGGRLFAGTDANVGIRLFGKHLFSRPHVLKSSQRRVLQRDSDDWFLLCSASSLGTLSSIQLWHDHLGHHPDWFCNKIVIYDIVGKIQYIFLVEQWLALGVDEFPEAIVRPASIHEIHNVKRIFLDNTDFGFRENHTWLSVFIRHPRSKVARKERVLVLAVGITSAMLGSIMFFDLSIEYRDGYDFFHINFGWRELVVSFEAFIVSAVMTLLVLFAFKKSHRHVPSKRKSLVDKPKNRSFFYEEPLEIWYSNKSTTYIELSDMNHHEFDPKDSFAEPNQGVSFYKLFIRCFKSQSSSKKLRPVVLGKKPSAEYSNIYWLILAWILGCVIIVTCTYFVILYSLKFGKKISIVWLCSLLMTFVQDIFIFSVLKILLLALLLSLASEKIVDVGAIELSLKDAIKAGLVGNPLYLLQLCKKRLDPMYHPLDKDLKQMLLARQRRLRQWLALLDFLLVIFFLLVLSLVMGNMWSSAQFQTNEHVTRLISQAHQPTHVSLLETFNRSHVFNRTLFNTFLQETMVSALYSFRWYNNVTNLKLTATGDSFRRKDWCNDFTSRLMGVPRLRQLRVKPDECYINEMFIQIEVECKLTWSRSNEDDRFYDLKWKEPAADVAPEHFNNYYWDYKSFQESAVFFLPGKIGIFYPPGGYIANLGASRNETLRIIKDLKQLNWIDQFTKAVFLEVTVYQVNNNLFTHMTIVIEHTPFGLYVVNLSTDSVHIEDLLSIWNSTYIVFTLALFMRVCYKINRNGFWNYLHKFWNTFELILIVIGVVSLIVYLVHLKVSSKYVTQFNSEGLDQFFNFEVLIFYFFITKMLLLILFFFTVFRIFISWNFGERYFFFYKTVALAKNNICCIGMLFVLFFLVIWRFFGYVMNVFVFSNYEMSIIHTKSFHFLASNNDPFQSHLTIFLLFLITSCLHFSCFLLFLYFYKIAKHNPPHTLTFNYFSLIFLQCKRKFQGKKDNYKK